MLDRSTREVVIKPGVWRVAPESQADMAVSTKEISSEMESQSLLRRQINEFIVQNT